MSQPPILPQHPTTPSFPAAIPYGQVERKPRVLIWFRVYCVLMALMHTMLIVLGGFFIAGTVDQNMTAEDSRVVGLMFVAIGLALVGAFVVGLVLPRRRWASTYGLVLIAYGFLSCLSMPASIPLLIFWIKPEVRAWFHEPS